MKMGIGPSSFSYYQSDQKLANLVDPKTSAFPPPKPGFAYARDGWPTKIPAGSYPDNWMGWVIAATEGYLAPGKYQIWAGGSGRFSFGHPDLAASNQQNTWDVKSPVGGPHRKVGEFEVHNPDAGRSMCCVFETDPANPLSHIMVIPATENTAAMFTKQYLDELRNFKCLRMAGFADVVNSPVVNWAEGAPPMGGHEAKVLSGIRLCNETGCDLWHNIPHMASDQYLQKLGTLTKAALKPDLTVYLEYSIEIWNWGWPFYTATKWVEDWGHANLGPNYPYQMAAVERAHHCQEVFCRYAPGVKVVRMFSNQNGYPWLMGQAGDYIKAKGYKFDAIATAPYFGPEDLDYTALDATLKRGDKEAALEMVFASSERFMMKLDGFANEYRKHCDNLGIPRLITYECGPSWQISPSSSPPLMELFHAYHQGERLRDFMLGRYFPWMAQYYDLAMYTSHTIKSLPGESWGPKETAGQTPHYKLDALLAWCKAHNG